MSLKKNSAWLFLLDRKPTSQDHFGRSFFFFNLFIPKTKIILRYALFSKISKKWFFFGSKHKQLWFIITMSPEWAVLLMNDLDVYSFAHDCTMNVIHRD